MLSEGEYSGVGDREAVVTPDRIASLFQKNNLKALIIGLAYMLLEPMTGTDVIDAYATQILSGTSFILGSPNAAAVFFPLFAIAANFLLLVLVDKVGRKVLTVVSGVGIVICLFSMSVYVFVTDKAVVADVNTTGGYLGVVPVVSLAGVRFLHGLGWGSVGFILLGELFPLKVKSVWDLGWLYSLSFFYSRSSVNGSDTGQLFVYLELSTFSLSYLLSSFSLKRRRNLWKR